MKNNFYDAATRSSISLDREQRPQGWTICRVNVLPARRGQGIASRLLTECTDEADRESVTLFLEPLPDVSGTGLDRVQLIAFYERHGFKSYKPELGFTWRRKPSSLGKLTS